MSLARAAEKTEGVEKHKARPRVVVVGGGFAGVSAVRALRHAEVEVTLLDRDPYNTFQPLLYQVATGGLSGSDITYSLRAFASGLSNTRFRQGEVTGIDVEGRRVHVDGAADVDYEYLIICCGVGANYFDIPGAAEYARPIYTRRESVEVRDSAFWNLEAFAQGREGALEPTVLIVGGGATGVEMAGAVAELKNVALAKAYPELDPKRIRVVLVEMADHVLGPFAPKLRDYAARELRDRGVELRLGTAVKEVGEHGVLLDDGERIESSSTIWASGVKADDALSGWGLPQGRNGRFEVEPDLRVVGHPGIFAVGDVAADLDDALPQLAQPAIQGGRHAGLQVGRLVDGLATEAFRYRDKGTMATIGRSDAVVELPHGVTLQGLIAWLAWLGLHIFMLMSNRNRLATMANLSVRYFTWKRSTNVIVGDPP